MVAEILRVESVPNSWKRPGPHQLGEQTDEIRKAFERAGFLMDKMGATVVTVRPLSSFVICTICSSPYNLAGTLVCGRCGATPEMALHDRSQAWSLAGRKARAYQSKLANKIREKTRMAREAI